MTTNRYGNKLERRITALHPQLREVAARVLARSGNRNVSPTDLLHDAYVKIAREEERRHDDDRSELAEKGTAVLRACYGRACKDILADRRKIRTKRREQPIDGLQIGEPAADSVHVRDAIHELAGQDVTSAQAARLVQMRYQGLTIQQCASALGISKRTANRRLQSARIWFERRFSA